MKTAITIIVLVIAGLLVGPLWSGNTGYVLIAVGNYTIETSLVASLILLVVVLLILRVILRFIGRLIRGTEWGIKWFGQRREVKAEQAFREALIQLNHGDYDASSRAINRAWQLRKLPTDALLAAYAAQRVGDIKQAREWLTRSHQTNELPLTEMILALRESSDAVERRWPELKALLADYPYHPSLLRYAILGMRSMQRYHDLADLLPRAAKQQLFSPQEFAALQEEVQFNLMLEAGRLGASSLQDYWQGLSRDQRRDAVIRRAYLRALKTFDATAAADKVAARALKRGELDIAYLLEHNLLVPGPELRNLIQEKLKQHPDDPVLLHALGQLALQTNDLTLAQRALRKAAEQQPSRQLLLDLAVTYDKLGDTANALRCYRERESLQL